MKMTSGFENNFQATIKLPHRPRNVTVPTTRLSVVSIHVNKQSNNAKNSSKIPEERAMDSSNLERDTDLNISPHNSSEL